MGSPAMGQSRWGRKRWEMPGSERGHSHSTAAARKGAVNRVDFGSFSYLGFVGFQTSSPHGGNESMPGSARHGPAAAPQPS